MPLISSTPVVTPRIIDDDETFQLRVVAGNDDKLWWQVSCTLNDKVDVVKARLTKGSGSYVPNLFHDGEQLQGKRTLRQNGVSKLSVLSSGRNASLLYGTKNLKMKNGDGDTMATSQKTTNGWNFASTTTKSIHKDNRRAAPEELVKPLHNTSPQRVESIMRTAGNLSAHSYDTTHQQYSMANATMNSTMGGRSVVSNMLQQPSPTRRHQRPGTGLSNLNRTLPTIGRHNTSTVTNMSGVKRPATAGGRSNRTNVRELSEAVATLTQRNAQLEAMLGVNGKVIPERHIKTPPVPLDLDLFVPVPNRTTQDGTFLHRGDVQLPQQQPYPHYYNAQ